MDVLERLYERARAVRPHVVLPEGTEPRTVQAAARAVAAGIARITLIGVPEEVRRVAAEKGVDLSAVDIAGVPESGREVEAAVRQYLERSRRRGIAEAEAREHVK